MALFLPLLAVVGLTWAIGTAASRAIAAATASPDPLAYVPARDLTDAQAREVLSQFEDARQIQVEDLQAPFVTLASNVDGVSFQYQGKPRLINHVDPRFAVLLVRFANRLRDRWNIVALEHAGIYPGRGAPNDVHNRGLAMDFSAARAVDGRVYSVLKDWGAKPKGGGDPGSAFRLPSSDPNHDVFADVYALFAQEGEDDPNGNHLAPPSAIGDHSLVISPDHPDPVLAAAHKDHMHVQIGPTKV